MTRQAGDYLDDVLLILRIDQLEESLENLGRLAKGEQRGESPIMRQSGHWPTKIDLALTSQD